MAAKKNKSKLIIVIILIVIGFFAYRSCAPQGDSEGTSHGMMGGGAAPVSIAEVIERDVQIWNEFSGRLVAVDMVEVRPQVSGVVESVNFENGAIVNKGDLLFTIDPRVYEAEVTRAEGALASANAQATLATTELTRAQRLLKEKAISQKEFDERKNSNNVAQANLKSAQALVDTARLNMDYTQVKAPIAGKISRAEITTGNLVEAGPNAPVLTTVVANNPIYADFEVDEETFLQYSNANATQIPVVVTMDSSSNKQYEGHIESFDNRLDPASGTIRARAVIDNSEGTMVPGLFARVKIGQPDNAPRVLITERAVGTDQNKKFVYVVGADNIAAYREINLGAPVDGGLRVVRSGLAAGDKIVVNGLQRVRPGQPITPELVSMDTGEPLQKAEAPKEIILEEPR